MPLERILIFIFNSDSGVLPKFRDYASHAIAPGTDGCTLYSLTYSPIGMKKEWKRFIRDLGIPARFLNRNEFSSEFGPRALKFPVVLVKTGSELRLLVSPEEINRCASLGDLIDLVQQRVAQIR
jgi:hypothetical protein